jgi:prepilin-type N-terminal cleavage/methylation domain-containing protein
MRHSRGFTLIELLVAMVIMLIVAGSIYTLLNTTQRVSRAQAERVDLQSNVRAGSIVVPNELRELNNVEGALAGPQVDILGTPSDTKLQYRAMRGIGFVCEVPTTGLVKILKSTWSGLRDPVAVRDAGYVFLEGADPDVSTDDGWQTVLITNVSTSTCVAANDAWAFTISPAVAALTAVPVPVGTPVRLYEVMELSLYANGGKSWLGARSVSGLEASPQPVLGPLVDGTGLVFKYLDKTGVQTALMSNVKSIRLTIHGITDHAIVKGGSSGAVQQVDDSLVSEVLLRNAFRP